MLALRRSGNVATLIAEWPNSRPLPWLSASSWSLYSTYFSLGPSGSACMQGHCSNLKCLRMKCMHERRGPSRSISQFQPMSRAPAVVFAQQQEPPETLWVERSVCTARRNSHPCDPAPPGSTPNACEGCQGDARPWPDKRGKSSLRWRWLADLPSELGRSL